MINIKNARSTKLFASKKRVNFDDEAVFTIAITQQWKVIMGMRTKSSIVRPEVPPLLHRSLSSVTPSIHHFWFLPTFPKAVLLLQ